MRARLLVALLLLAALVAGCGESSEEKDEQIAQASLLTLDDLPEGWTSTPADEDDDSGIGCIDDLADDSFESTADAESGDFDAPGDTALVTSSVSIYADDVQAQSDVDLFASARAQACVEGYFGEQLAAGLEGSGVEVLNTTVSPSDGPSGLGDGNGGILIEILVGAEGGDVGDARFTFEVLAVRTGRGVAVLGFGGMGDAFDAGLREQVTRTAVDRLAAELDG